MTRPAYVWVDTGHGPRECWQRAKVLRRCAVLPLWPDEPPRPVLIVRLPGGEIMQAAFWSDTDPDS